MAEPFRSSALQEIVDALDRTREHTPATLASALDRPITIDDVAPWVRFDAKNYVRNLVTRADRWELRLLCWRPGQTSSLHGHGAAACAFRVLRGSATESILGERDRVWAPGDLVEETRPALVHQVGNAASDSLITLHAYSPQLPVDAPSTRDGRNIVIVGGGFSGVAVAIHLLRRAREDLRITLVERGPWLGRGVAYGVDSRVFRLNVPAAKMSLDPQDPLDFVRWSGSEQHPGAFLSRSQFGRYVVERFGQALRASAGKLRVVRGDAARISADSVVMVDGTEIPAQHVVLATGLAPRIAPSSLPSDSRIVDAWDECALAALPRDGRILVLGSGLSALDVLGFLDVHGFRGQVDVVSRRGLLPRPHVVGAGPPPTIPHDVIAAAPNNLLGLLRWGRRLIAEQARAGVPWQLGIDSLRPHIASLWRGLAAHDRARFVRTVRPYWEVLRHRAPQEAHQLVDTWREARRLELMAAAIATCEAQPDGLAVQLRTSAGDRIARQYQAIVRCIGPALESSEMGAPLVRALIDDGWAMPDPAGLGIVTDEMGRVVGPRGPSARVYALGVLRRASSWETSAVPDITAHAHILAEMLTP